MDYDNFFKIGEQTIGNWSPTYFIADIGANHDGNLGRAKDLIKLAKEYGADCAKFQHFQASKIVSAVGFDGMKSAHQRGWDKSVFEVYQDYSINPDWNEVLAATCKESGIDFMSTPYDIESAFALWPLMPAFKIGSGDITYLSYIEAVAKLQNPIFLATGASTMDEVAAAVETVLAHNPRLCLMQCNTNYTGNLENFNHVNLRVLQTYMDRWPDMPLGLSDHTPGCTAVLGAVALGARVIEKHFTDDDSRKGPDHSFAMTPIMWREMVLRTRDLESAMGDGRKVVEENEFESRIVQRRAIRIRTNDEGFPAGTVIGDSMIEFLRPCPEGAFTPAQRDEVIGRRLTRYKRAGAEIYPDDVE